MPSTPTTRLRVEKQALGENLNLWGDTKLNAALDRLEEGIAAVTSVAIAGTATTLTSTNYVADQARSACLVFTGTLTANSTVTVPNVEKLYLCINSTTGSFSLTVKTAAGTGYALRAGPNWVYCDATNVAGAVPRLDQAPLATASVDLNAQKITNLGTPTTTTDAATKAYVDAIGGGVASVYQPGAGSAAVPSYTFSTDTNTGMYSGGADALAFSTGGSNRATISSGGDVGIGATPLSNTNSKTLTLSGTLGGTVELCNTSGTIGPRLWGDSSDNTLNLSSHNASGKIHFRTAAGVVRTTIDDAGHLLHGQNSTTTPGYGNTTVGTSLQTAGRLFISAASGGFSNWNLNGTGTVVTFSSSATTVGSISISGFATSFNTSSDYRLKENITPLAGAVNRLLQLKPCTFSFKADPAHGTYEGFIAHEAQAVVPTAVTGEKDGAGMQSMDPGKIIPLLVGAVQELAARVAALEAA
jgi:hypothetical protein